MKFGLRAVPRVRQSIILTTVGLLLIASGSSTAQADETTPTPATSATATPKPAVPSTSVPTTPDPTNPDPTTHPSTADPSTQERDSAPASPAATASPSQEARSDATATAEQTSRATPSKASTASPRRQARAQAVPQPTGNDAVVTVKTGADRAGVQSVTPLPGVQLGLYAAATGGTPLFTCTSDTAGDCSVVVPNAQRGGANYNKQFWVRQIDSPTGWTPNTLLRTGDGDGAGSVSTAYRFQTPQLVAGQTYDSQTRIDFMLGSGVDNRSASGGVWQSSRVNPGLDPSCGLDVALVLDFSGSVGSAAGALKNAASTLVSSLQGTPSKMSLFSFSSLSPADNAAPNYPNLTPVATAAQATAFKARYAGWTAAGGTNWDRAFAAVAAAADRPDVTVVITDGNPTFYNQPAAGPGNFGRLREIENGIFSANAVKRDGSRMLAIGVGGGADDVSTARNLVAISGPTAYTGSNIGLADYYQATDYAAAGTALRSLALGNCLGTVSVNKQIVPSTNTGENVTGAVSAGAGWIVGGQSTATIGGLPATKTTTADGTGTVNFPLSFPGGVNTAPINLRETQQSGFTLVTQGGQNAVCRNLVTGDPVAVTNDNAAAGQPGFTVAASPTAAVACTVYNRAPQPRASVTVDKQWVIDGRRFTNGAQPGGFTAELSLTGPGGAGATPQGWGETREGYSVGSTTTVSEKVNLISDLCKLDSAQIARTGDAGAGQPLPYAATLSAAENTYLVTNTVTCTSRLTLVKEVEGGDAAATGWTLTAIAPAGSLPGPQGTTGTAGVTNVTVTPQVIYQLAESGGDPNYAQIDARTDLESNPRSTGSMSCIQVDAQGNQIPGFSDGLNGGVRVPTGARIRCTAINQTASLELRKLVQNRFGGTAVPADWTLTATPTGANLPDRLSAQSVTGSADYQRLDVRPGVTYRLTESGGPAGYQPAGPISCQIPPGSAKDGDTVVIEPLDTSRCTYTNADTSATLTLRKVVDNGATGGIAVATAWTLDAAGPTPIQGTSGSAAVTGAAVSAGTYTLSETNGPAGYAGAAWSCTGATADGATVTVPTGGTVACTITNTAQPPRLTLVNTVTNSNGGTAVPSDWTLTADGPTTLTGTTGVTATVPVGGYTLKQTDGPSGYTAGDWSCTGAVVVDDVVTMPLGGDVVCTIANADQPAQLTLVKTVDNQQTGATAPATDWTLAAQGPTPISGATGEDVVTSAAVSAGSYTLTETGPAGYDASAWTCRIGPRTTTGATLTLAIGQDATCTIINTAQQPRLTLVKTVDNGPTGAAGTASDFTLTASGGAVSTTVTGPGGSATVTDQPVPIGTYDLSETGPSGYDASSWVCTGGRSSTPSTVTLDLGSDATCTIANTAQQPRLTLVKTVTNDNGGTAVPTDWTLTADGPTAFDGPTGSAAVTSVSVLVGSYDLAENGGPAGYAAGDWSCSGARLDGSTVIIELGDDATCTLDNDDQPARLTLVKEVAPNQTGSTKSPADWTLTATREPADPGQPVISGNGDPGSEGGVRDVTVIAGTYSLGESGPTGFTPGAWECTGGVVTNGDLLTVTTGSDVTCTITNTADSPRLTLVKQVVNNDGGTAQPVDWTLAADGPSPINGVVGDPAVTDAAVQVGRYTLSESGPNDYTASQWSCEGAKVLDGQLTLAEGDDVVCTITNDDIAPRYSIVKTSDPKSGSTVQPGDDIVYSLVATRTGGVEATNVVLTDDLSQVLNHATLDEGYQVTSGDVVLNGTSITWTIPILSDIEVLTYTVQVDPDAYGVILTNRVSSRGSSPCEPAAFARGDARVGTSSTRSAKPTAAELCPTTTIHRTPKRVPSTPSPPPAPPSVSPPVSPGLGNTGGPSLILPSLGLLLVLAGAGVLLLDRRSRLTSGGDRRSRP